jgi:hypothetical protein
VANETDIQKGEKMARRVFFSFHYERDIWRANCVRNCWVTKPDREDAGFWDAAQWEEVKKQGDDAIKRWINSHLDGTSVTAVLIGAETSQRQWVDYEIEQSHKRGNGLIGIFIHNIKDQNQQTDTRGTNPFDLWTTTINGNKVNFSQLYKSYDWINDNGYDNIGDWVEEAAKNAGR